MKALPLYCTEPADELAWPIPPLVTIDSSALEILTDFTQVSPMIIESTLSALEVKNLMKKEHERVKCVVDQNGHFSGLVSLDNINTQEVVKKVASGSSRDELNVTDFMYRKEELKAFDYADLERASIGDVIHVLKHSGQQYCLVIDRASHQIRGVISANELTQKINLPIEVGTELTFANVFKELHH